MKKVVNILNEIYNNSKDETYFYDTKEIIKIMENSLKIHEKFPPNNSYRTLEIFDKLLINLSEEYIESEEEIKNLLLGVENSKEKLLYEIADVVDYTFTIIMVLFSSKEFEQNNEITNDYLKATLITFLSSFSNYLSYFNELNSEKELPTEFLHKSFCEQYFSNIKIRRNWSNRKWHKKQKEDINNDTEVIKKLIDNNFDFIFNYLAIMSYLNKSNLTEVLSFLVEKQQIILNL